MRIAGIEGNAVASMKPATGKKSGTVEGPGTDFGELLTDYVQHVDSLQDRANASAKKLAMGQIQNPHDLAMVLNEAELSFKLMTQIRNKMVGAYQEIMRMKV